MLEIGSTVFQQDYREELIVLVKIRPHILRFPLVVEVIPRVHQRFGEVALHHVRTIAHSISVWSSSDEGVLDNSPSESNVAFDLPHGLGDPHFLDDVPDFALIPLAERNNLQNSGAVGVGL